MKRKLKQFILFYFILAIVWVMTEYKEPKETLPPKVVRRQFPMKRPYNFPKDFFETHTNLAGVFEDSTSMFTGGNIPVLILPPFTMVTGNSTAELINLVTESAFYHLYNDQKIRIVRRNYDEKNRSRIRANYILIGRISTIGNQIRITVRIQDINTGEILDAFDDYINIGQISKYL
jgi:TolB-like protein